MHYGPTRKPRSCLARGTVGMLHGIFHGRPQTLEDGLSIATPMATMRILIRITANLYMIRPEKMYDRGKNVWSQSSKKRKRKNVWSRSLFTVSIFGAQKSIDFGCGRRTAFFAQKRVVVVFGYGRRATYAGGTDFRMLLCDHTQKRRFFDHKNADHKQ